MDQSLSIIIAAHNAQHQLAQQVADLLELATDLTPDFELMIVDDGSEDATEEVAYELTREFPQVRLVRHHESLGVSAAVRSGMCETRGMSCWCWRDRCRSASARFAGSGHFEAMKRC